MTTHAIRPAQEHLATGWSGSKRRRPDPPRRLAVG